jgi:hypothetical protein
MDLKLNLFSPFSLSPIQFQLLGQRYDQQTLETEVILTPVHSSQSASAVGDFCVEGFFCLMLVSMFTASCWSNLHYTSLHDGLLSILPTFFLSDKLIFSQHHFHFLLQGGSAATLT